MIKVMVIGTSHVAALRLGWESISKDFSEYDVSFFGVGGSCGREIELDDQLRYGLLGKTKFTDSWLSIENSFGTKVVNLSLFDAVIYAGFNSNDELNAALANRFSIDGVAPCDGLPRLSLDAYCAFCDSFAIKALAESVFRVWKPQNLFLIPRPLPSETIVDSLRPNDQLWAEFLNRESRAPHLFPTYYERVSSVLAASGVFLSPPPEQVLAAHGLTKSEYCRDRLKLVDAENPEIDHRHMNDQYGAIVLSQVLSAIGRTGQFKDLK